MGQYYRGAILNKEALNNNEIKIEKSLCCYIHGNGAKLMEHSYVGNTYVGAYLDQQMTIEKVAGSSMVKFSKTIVQIGASV